MKREENPWSVGVVMVCTKCQKYVPASTLSEEGNPGENLKNYLKKNLRESGDAGKIRPVTSSCLDVCMKGYQAVAFSSVNGETETFILHPEYDRKELLHYLKLRCT